MTRSPKARRSRGRGAQYAAPWSRGVRGLTFALLGLWVLMLIVLPLVMPARAGWAPFLGPGIMTVVFGGIALFCVRGFTLSHDELLIQRLFWRTAVSLRELRHAYADPEAMKRSLRKAGNGGFLGYTGWFWSKRLGGFRAYVTDPARCVVLEFKDRRIVVSPDDPQGFVQALGVEAEPGKDRR